MLPNSQEVQLSTHQGLKTPSFFLKEKHFEQLMNLTQTIPA